MSYLEAIKAIKLDDILFYKKDLQKDLLKEFKNNEEPYLVEENIANANLFLNHTTMEIEIFEWNEYKVESLKKNNNQFNESDFLKKGTFGNEYFGILLFKNFLGYTSFKDNNIHVLSKKITDENLNNIIEVVNSNISCLSFDFQQPTSSKIKRNNKLRTNKDYYIFLYIMNILKTKDKGLNFFYNFKILENDPYRVFTSSFVDENINNISNFDEDTLISIFQSSYNVIPAKNNNNKLSKRLSKDSKSYLPQKVLDEKYLDSFDNPENRFIKFFIKNSLMILEKFYIHFLNNKNSILDESLINETKTYIEKLKRLLQFSFLNHVEDLVFIPMNSTVLTRKSGYNKIFKSYLKLKSVPENILSDSKINEFIENKSIDVVYELYCYFTLVNLLTDIYKEKITDKKITTAYSESEYSENLSKKNNENYIYFNKKGPLPNIKMHYNKTYSAPTMTYSKQYDPDISIEIIEDDTIKEIYCFDAKFKVNSKSNDYKFKDEDISKMHAYKDAIKLCKGAFILYPGSFTEVYTESGNKKDKNSVGAFSLLPNSRDKLRKLKDQIIFLLS